MLPQDYAKTVTIQGKTFQVRAMKSPGDYDGDPYAGCLRIEIEHDGKLVLHSDDPTVKWQDATEENVDSLIRVNEPAI